MHSINSACHKTLCTAYSTEQSPKQMLLNSMNVGVFICIPSPLIHEQFSKSAAQLPSSDVCSKKYAGTNVVETGFAGRSSNNLANERATTLQGALRLQSKELFPDMSSAIWGWRGSGRLSPSLGRT